MYLSDINFFKLLSGARAPIFSHSTLIKEWQSSHWNLPLTVDLLIRCIWTLHAGYLSPSIDLTLKTMFLIAFFFHWCLECTISSFTYDTSRHASISICSLDILRFNLKQNKTDQLGVSTSIFLFRFNFWACSNRSKTSQDLFFTRLPLILVTPTALKLLLLLPDKELQTTQWKFLAIGLGPSLPQLCPYPTQWHPMSPFSSHPVRWRLCLY